MLVGKELGPYLVEKELGSGAMGTVFRAKSKKSGEFVAIKLMSLALGTSETAINRFVREVAILKQLDHPNIVKYKGSGRYHGAPFYIMEYVEGESLDHILNRQKKLPWEDVINIGFDLCAGLQHAHDKGIIHRDLKPSNLMVLTSGVVKLTDFGIAKDTDVTALTAANSTVGTAAYMSPEQCRGARDITHKSDLYSMGIMFYELLTGKKPFVGETVMEVFMQHANSTKYKRPNELVPEVPLWLNELVDQLMAKEASKRPLNAKAVAESLQLIKSKIETQRRASPKPKGEKPKAGKKPALEEPEQDRPAPRKKPKAEAQAFYTRGWFTILSLFLVACALGTFVYFAFLKTPDAESLYAQAQTLMASDKAAARAGPIADFLRYHPHHEKIAAIQRWADDVDFELRERQMLNRRSSPLGKVVTEEEEKLARAALDHEDEGRLAEAEKSWAELAARKGNSDANLHAWGLVGDRYLKDVKGVRNDYDQLKSRIEANEAPEDAFDTLAIEARRKELAAEKVRAEEEAEANKLLAQARTRWEELQRQAKAGSPRRWYLLANERLRQLKDMK